jgi:Zn-dependent protease
MFGSFRLGTILGIPVGVNWSVLFIAGLIAWSLAGQILPVQVPGLDESFYWLAGGLGAALFFGSLLAHELSHAIVARRNGLTVSGITLWLLGGVARMDGEARSPGAEARIAGVGPLTSLALALLFGLSAFAMTAVPQTELVALATASAAWLAFVNLVLALFNLLPGAPLDGGRIARAVFWRVRKDKMQATRWSTGLGQILGYGLIGLGLFRAFAGDIGGIWFVLLGFFLNTAAAAERQSSELLGSLRGVRVGDIMNREPMRVPGGLTVETFISEAVRESRTSSWLVSGPGGTVEGVLSLDALRSVRGDERATKRIGELAVPLERWPAADVDEPVLDLLQRLGNSEVRAVVRGSGTESHDVIGLLSPEDISRTVALRGASGRRDDERPSTEDDASEGRVLP